MTRPSNGCHVFLPRNLSKTSKVDMAASCLFPRVRLRNATSREGTSWSYLMPRERIAICSALRHCSGDRYRHRDPRVGEGFVVLSWLNVCFQGRDPRWGNYRRQAGRWKRRLSRGRHGQATGVRFQVQICRQGCRQRRGNDRRVSWGNVNNRVNYVSSWLTYGRHDYYDHEAGRTGRDSFRRCANQRVQGGRRRRSRGRRAYSLGRRRAPVPNARLRVICVGFARYRGGRRRGRCQLCGVSNVDRGKLNEYGGESVSVRGMRGSSRYRNCKRYPVFAGA